MFRKIITKLYNKYCKPDISQLYLGGIQRDLSYELNEKDEKEIVNDTKHFISTKAFEYLFNYQLKQYLEVLLSKGETERTRDFCIYTLNILLGFEREFLEMAKRLDKPIEKFDKYNPI